MDSAFFRFLTIASFLFSFQQTLAQDWDQYDAKHIEKVLSLKPTQSAFKDPQLLTYFNRFIELGRQAPIAVKMESHGYSFHSRALLDGIELRLAENSGCRIDPEQGIRIAIDRTLWYRAAPPIKEQLAFQAMGHCLYGFRFDSRFAKVKGRWIPASLMAVDLIRATTYVKYRRQYLSALFKNPKLNAPVPAEFWDPMSVNKEELLDAAVDAVVVFLFFAFFWMVLLWTGKFLIAQISRVITIE